VSQTRYLGCNAFVLTPLKFSEQDPTIPTDSRLDSGWTTRLIYRLAQAVDSGLGVDPTAAELLPPELAGSPARCPALNAVAADVAA
jgi:hypothetical protein